MPVSWIVTDPLYRRFRRSFARYHLRVFQVTVPQIGFYSLVSISTIDTYGCLYLDDFDHSHPDHNLLTFNDQSGSDDQFGMSLILQPNRTYYLVATTFRPWRVGNITVRVTGPDAATLTDVSSEDTNRLNMFHVNFSLILR